jgi:hypothetical protein
MMAAAEQAVVLKDPVDQQRRTTTLGIRSIADISDPIPGITFAYVPLLLHNNEFVVLRKG